MESIRFASIDHPNISASHPASILHAIQNREAVLMDIDRRLYRFGEKIDTFLQVVLRRGIFAWMFFVDISTVRPASRIEKIVELTRLSVLKFCRTATSQQANDQYRHHYHDSIRIHPAFLLPKTPATRRITMAQASGLFIKLQPKPMRNIGRRADRMRPFGAREAQARRAQHPFRLREGTHSELGADDRARFVRIDTFRNDDNTAIVHAE